MAHEYTISIIVASLMAVIAVVSVALRLAARRKSAAGFGADDWCIVAALIFVLATCADCLVGALSGHLGKHQVDFAANGAWASAEVHRMAIVRFQVTWSMQWLAALGPGLTKISVLLFYNRIFLGRTIQLAINTLLALSVAWTIAFFFTIFLGCLPLNCNWLGGNECRCIGNNNVMWPMAFTDVFLDFFILVLPWYPVGRLQLSLRRKISVFAIFGLGGFVVAAAIVRFVALKDAITSNSDDFSYIEAPAVYWTTVEASMGVVSACLPTLGPLFKDRHPSGVMRSLLTAIPKSKSSKDKTSRGSLNDVDEIKLTQAASFKYQTAAVAENGPGGGISQI